MPGADELAYLLVLEQGDRAEPEVDQSISWIRVIAVRHISVEIVEKTDTHIVERIGGSEARAERGYRTGMDAQRAADATGIPRLSAAPEAAIGVVAAASTRRRGPRPGGPYRRTSVSLANCGPSVLLSSSGSGRRACALYCGPEGRPGAVTAASVAREQRPELDRVAELNVAWKGGERASVVTAQRETERQEQRRGMRT